jgi:hypothetical protein
MGRKRSHSASSLDDIASPFAREPSTEVKIIHLGRRATPPARTMVINCELPPHKRPWAFNSQEEYDVHYQKMHVNRCSVCHKNFPDQHLLQLHISENHDPIRAARADRGEKTYQCLIPTCDRLCSTAPKRRRHCIDKHNVSKDYDFFIINDGIDRRTSMLIPSHRRRSSTLGTANGIDIAPNEEDDDMESSEADEEGEAHQEDPQSQQLKLRGKGGVINGDSGLPPSYGRGSTPRRGKGRGASASGETKISAQAASAPDPMEDITSSMSALQFVPRSVGRGRGRGRGRGQT